MINSEGGEGMSTQKPIKLFFSALTDHVYASRAYKDLGEGRFLITGNKYDVTDDAKAIAEQIHGGRIADLEALARDMYACCAAASCGCCNRVNDCEGPTGFYNRMVALGLIGGDEQ